MVFQAGGRDTTGDKRRHAVFGGDHADIECCNGFGQGGWQLFIGRDQRLNGLGRNVYLNKQCGYTFAILAGDTGWGGVCPASGSTKSGRHGEVVGGDQRFGLLPVPVAQGWRNHCGRHGFCIEREVLGFGSGRGDLRALLGSREQCVAVPWAGSGGNIDGGIGCNHTFCQAVASGGSVESGRSIVCGAWKHGYVVGECGVGSGVNVPMAQGFGAD